MYNENKVWNFPAGEVGVNHFTNGMKMFDLHLRGGTSDEIMKVLLQANAIRNQDQNAYIHLLAPYVPYGRQDRVSAPGTSFSLEVFAQVLGTARFNQISIVDPHSQTTVDELKKHIDRVDVYHAYDFIDKRIVEDIPYREWSEIVVLAPDKGAVQRAQDCARTLGIAEVHFAEKVRDPSSGEILGIVAPTIKANHHVLIIDDICDGGRTFIELAKVLEGKCASKTLFVTHGIFSKGYWEVALHFDKVWTTDSFEPTGPTEYIIPLNKYINW